MSILTIFLILIIVAGFVAMTFRILKQDVAMPLVALFALVLAGNKDGLLAIQDGFAEFSHIALLFTAVAVPAHIVQRSKLFDWIGMWLGELIGKIWVKTHIKISVLISTLCLLMVYVLAGLFHNTTSILVSCTIIFIVCKSYKIKSKPILAGALVSSNLGGFSTRWGDTPNIIESAQWGLIHRDFFMEIMPINLLALAILISVISFWVYLVNKVVINSEQRFNTVYALVKFREARRNMSLDKKLIAVGALGLVLAVIGPLFFLEYEILFSSLAIITSVIGDYSEHRSETLLALGIETYATLAAIFVLAQVLTESHIGMKSYLENLLLNSDGNIYAITSISYLGTLLTEAASWASAASPIVYEHNNTHIGAWALGSGIFAGSSSIITAASAGIILTQETKDFPADHQINFGSYIKFGLPFSLLMLLFFSVVLSIIKYNQ